MTDEQRKFALIAFTIYTLGMEVLIFGTTTFLIWTQGASLYWLILAFVLASLAYIKPNTFKGFFKDTEPKTDAL